MKNKIHAIWAEGIGGVIGVGNQLPWHNPKDLKFFKRMTEDGIVIMGRKTYQSIGKPLPNRTNIVITSRPHLIKDNSVIVMSNPEAVLDMLNDSERKRKIFVIGGSQIYESFMPYIDEIYVTYMDRKVISEDLKYAPYLSDYGYWHEENVEVHNDMFMRKYTRRSV